MRATTAIGTAMLLSILTLVAVAPVLPGYDPFAQHLSAALTPPFADPAHLLGTDPLGRDILSRLALAGRTSITIALSALAISLGLGTLLGFLAGYFGGPADAAIMGIGDIQLAIPILLLLVLVVALAGPSASTLVLALGLTTWVGYARVARLLALSLREREFVLAARVQGASVAWIMRRHLLPQVVPQLAILGSFNLGVLIILESGLSYLGLGVPPPTPSWGTMISEGQDFLQVAPFLCLWPGVMICLLVGGVQILSQRFTGEGAAAVGMGA